MAMNVWEQHCKVENNEAWEWHQRLQYWQEGLGTALKAQELGTDLGNVGNENSSGRKLRELVSFSDPFILDYE